MHIENHSVAVIIHVQLFYIYYYKPIWKYGQNYDIDFLSFCFCNKVYRTKPTHKHPNTIVC